MEYGKIKVGGSKYPSTNDEKDVVTRHAFMKTLDIPEKMMGDDVTLDAYIEFAKIYRNSSWMTFEAMNNCKVITASGFGKVDITDNGIETGFFIDAFIIDGLNNVASIIVNEESTITFKNKLKDE